MQTEVKRRIVWFSVFMVWLGMVGAILIFQETNPDILPSVADSLSESQSSAGQNTDQTKVENSASQPSANQQADPAKQTTVKEESSKNTDYFVQYRLELDKVRSDQISTCRETINNPNTDPATKKINQEKILQIQNTIEQEIKVESLIKLKGYPNVVALISGDNTSISLVILGGLTEEDAAKIHDIVAQVTKIRAENITITEIQVDE